MRFPAFFSCFQRYDIKLWLVFFTSVIWLIPAAAYAAQGVIEDNTNAIILGILGLLGAVVTLLGGVVLIIKTLLKQRSPQVRDSNALSAIMKSIEAHELREERKFDEIHEEIARIHLRIDDLVRDWARL